MSIETYGKYIAAIGVYTAAVSAYDRGEIDTKELARIKSVMKAARVSHDESLERWCDEK